MRKRAIFGLGLVTLLVALVPVAGAAGTPQVSRFEGFGTTFKLQGTNGYEIWVSAYSRRRDGRGWISVGVGGKHAAATYRAPARVLGEAARDSTATSIEADLGRLGRVDLLLNRSGREESFRFPCAGPKFSYEPGVYEGTFEFAGEEGFTRATASSIPFEPGSFFLAGDCNGSGYGEATGGPDIAGARLKGVSFGHDRILTFQVNKNNPRSRVVYTASVREQLGGVYIYRTIEGSAGPGAFRFDPHLRSARLSPPAPFSGSATARRDRSSLLLSWQGNLVLAFPGHTIPLAGPSVHVSLVHAHFTRSNSGSVAVGI
jgi:hypothetical protein